MLPYGCIIAYCLLLLPLVHTITQDTEATKKASIILAVEDHPVLFLRQTLRSLEELEPNAKLNIEVIIVPVVRRDYESRDALRAVLSSREAFQKFTIVDSTEQDDTVVKAFNRGAKVAKGDYLVFMVDTTEIASINTISSMVKILDNKDNGVVGAKLIFPDETIYHAGIEFALQKDPKATGWEPWSITRTEEPTKEVASLSYRLQGYTWKDKRSIEKEEVPAVSKALMAITKTLFLLAGGFNESYSVSYYDVDLCLKISQNLGKKIIYNPSSIALYNDKTKAELEYDTQDENAKKDISLFNSTWGDHVKAEVEKDYELTNFTLVWNMECGTGQVLGFTTEAMNFVLALHKKLKLKIEVNREEDCKKEIKKAGLPLVLRNTLARLMTRQVSHTEDVVSIIHRDPGRYSYFVNTGNTLEYIIGRSMYETDKIPSDWPASCNSWKIDKIWVPTEFNRETFTAGGVNASKIDVVPELVDVHHFDSSIHSPLLEIPQTDSVFRFLSILKWEPRKAWDVLLKAYFEEFKEDTDKVRLYIMSRLDEEAKGKYNKFLDEYKTSAGINDSSLLPPVEIINTMFPYTKLPSLYKSVNCMVLPSHGEGWGLPLTEAMSMNLPTIGTYWSGTTAFMNDNNSFLVDVAGMEPATTEGHQWATPNHTVLRQHMRTVFENGDAVAKKASRARVDIENQFSLEAVGAIVLSKLKEIQANLPESRAAKQLLKAEDEARKLTVTPTSTVPPSWYSANPPSWTNSWGSSVGGQEFVDDDGKKKFRIKINNQ